MTRGSKLKSQRTTKGELQTSATHRQARQTLKDKNETRSAARTQTIEEDQLAQVNVTLRHTKNLGNYESMVFGVSVTQPTPADNIDDGIRKAQATVESHLQRIIREWMGTSED